MNFREEYGDYSAQEAVDAIILILKRSGVEVDEKSFAWTLVGALFDNGIISRTARAISMSAMRGGNPRQQSVRKCATADDIPEPPGAAPRNWFA